MTQPVYAGFWIRVVAALIDSVIFLLCAAIPLSLLYGAEYWSSSMRLHGGWDLFIQYLAPAILSIWFWTRFMGTPGKLIMGLQVVDANTGEALSKPQALGRYLGYYVSIVPLMLGIIWVAFDVRKQGWHDKLAGTLVIKAPPKD